MLVLEERQYLGMQSTAVCECLQCVRASHPALVLGVKLGC